MLKRKRVSLVLLTMFLLVAILAAPALAWQTRHADDKQSSGAVMVKTGEVINDDLFMAGESIRIDGTVNGDVVVLANSVDVTGTINGDLLVGCSNLNVSGIINDDLRIAAQDARITGQVKRNLSAAGSHFIIDKDAIVGGNVAFGGENLSIAGLVQGGLQAAVGQLNLTGKIGQNVGAKTDDLNVLPGATIGGSLNYRGANKGNISPEAKIGGPVSYKYFVPQHRDKPEPQHAPWMGILVWMLVGFMSLMLVWLLWFYLSPSSFIKVQGALIKAPWASLGWGFALLILLPIAAILVMVTVVGIPIALAALILYGTVLFVGKLIVGYGLTYYLATRYQIAALQKPFAAAAVGTLVLMLLNVIPWVGTIVTMVVALMALGSVFIALKDGLAARKAIS
ncbi:MAG: hypothetical protein ACM3PA_01735 [Methanomassiliicoccales archaeon]